jgi:disulfide bond formation protein DsbB
MVPFGKLATIKSSWMLLGFSALALELSALYFQYGMMLEPCIMCIYQRVAIMGIMFSGFITAIAPNLMVLRLFTAIMESDLVPLQQDLILLQTL